MNKYNLNKVLFVMFAFLLLAIIAIPSKLLANSYTVSIVPNCTGTSGTSPQGVSCSSMTMIKFTNAIDTKQERIDVQKVLNKVLSPSPNLTTDGVFGTKTITAIKTFQTQHSLTADGKVGTKTIIALEQAQIDYYNSNNTCANGATNYPTCTTPIAALTWTDELMQNGGFETGSLSGWTTSGTNWKVGFDVSNGSAGCQAGIYCAYASTPSKSSGYIYQDVNLTSYGTSIDQGKAVVTASGYGVSSEYPGQDKAQIKIMFLNSSKGVISTALDSGVIDSVSWWQRSITSYLIPANTRYIRMWGNTYETNYASGNLDSFSVKVGYGGATTSIDTIKPIVTSFTIPITSSSFTIPVTAFTATDDKGVTGYMITNTPTAPLAGASGWSTTAPTLYLSNLTAINTLFAWAKDAAGNVSAYASATTQVNITDITKPTVTAFTIPGTYATTSLPVSIPITTFTATDNSGTVTGYLLTESSTAPAATSITSTTPTISYSFSTAGQKTLYAWAKDGSNNVSLSKSAIVVISQTSLVDTQKPTISAFTLLSSYTTRNVTPSNFNYSDNVGVTGYYLSDSSTTPTLYSTWISISTVPTINFISDGVKTVYVWVRDAAGNISNVFISTTTINTVVADTTKPTITAFSIPTTSSSLTVSISSFTATDNIGVTGYILAESYTTPVPTKDSSWSAGTPSSFTFSSSGTKILYAWVRDLAGNVSNTANSNQVTITIAATVCPAGTTGTYPNCTPINGTGHTYYVATNGSDKTGVGDGSITKPWASWQKGFESLNPGDTLYIRGGNYTAMGSNARGVSISGRSGTTSDPIKVLAYPGETPILDCSGLNSSSSREGIIIENSSYWYIKGLIVENVPDTTSIIGSGWTMSNVSDITLEQCTVRDSANGFILYGGDNILYKNCDSYQNHDQVNGGDLNNGFYSRVYEGQTVAYEGCRAWLNSDDGWDSFVSTSSGGGGTITYNSCWAFENGPWAGGDEGGNGAGFKTGATADNQTSGTLRKITNSLSFDNQGYGFDESQDGTYGNSIQHIFYNNTSYNNSVAYNFRDGAGKNGIFIPDIIKNNISYNDKSITWTGFGNNIVENNSWQIGTVTANDFVNLDSAQAKLSRQTDGSLPYIDFLRPKTTSSFAGIGAFVTAPSVLGVSKHNFTENLKFGSTGNEVMELQKLLSFLGYLKVTPNGTFGGETLKAVKEYQEANGLTPDGIVGLKTRGILNK